MKRQGLTPTPIAQSSRLNAQRIAVEQSKRLFLAERSSRLVGGFTLVEVLVVALIMTLVGGAALVLAQSGRQVSDLTNARLTAMTDAELALSRLTEDLRMASTSSMGGERGIECLEEVHALPPLPGIPARLRFKRVMPDGTLSGMILYWLADNQLMASGPVGGERVVASGVTAFDYSSVCNGAANASGMARVRLTAEANSLQGPMTQTVDSQVWIRNPSSS